MALDRRLWVLIVLRLDCASLSAMLFEIQIYEVAIGQPLAGRCARMRRSGRRARMTYCISVCVAACSAARTAQAAAPVCAVSVGGHSPC